jgi:hypothetical protein
MRSATTSPESPVIARRSSVMARRQRGTRRESDAGQGCLRSIRRRSRAPARHSAPIPARSNAVSPQFSRDSSEIAGDPPAVPRQPRNVRPRFACAPRACSANQRERGGNRTRARRNLAPTRRNPARSHVQSPAIERRSPPIARKSPEIQQVAPGIRRKACAIRERLLLDAVRFRPVRRESPPIDDRSRANPSRCFAMARKSCPDFRRTRDRVRLSCACACASSSSTCNMYVERARPTSERDENRRGRARVCARARARARTRTRKTITIAIGSSSLAGAAGVSVEC